MRLVRWIGLLGLVVLLSPASVFAEGGDFYTRIRSNDAPIGGRFTIFVYMLDSLDAVVEMPGPGRVLLLNFRESNGKSSFIIPGDLSIVGPNKNSWEQGFMPLGDKRLAGLLQKNESRWAMWWIPERLDSVTWDLPTDITFHYGFGKSAFIPLEERDRKATLEALPWEAILETQIDFERPCAQLTYPPDPAAFDKRPEAKERTAPQYPKSSRMYSYEGTVHVVAVVDVSGKVEDTFVLHSNATHDLNVSALSAVMNWIFKPGRKGGIKVGGETVIPVQFSLQSVK